MVDKKNVLNFGSILWFFEYLVCLEDVAKTFSLIKYLDVD